MKAGIHLDVLMSDYVLDTIGDEAPTLNAGTAHRLIAECPKSAWFHHKRLNTNAPDESTKEQDIGSIVHSILLEGSMECVAVIDPQDYPAEKTGNIPDGWTNKAIRVARNVARDAGKIPILKAGYQEIEDMVGSAMEFIAGSDIEEVWMDSDREAVMLYYHGGVWLRTRPDCLSKDRRMIVDVKTTTGSAAPDIWARTQLPGRNELQGALGLRGLRTLAPTERHDPTFCFLVIEQQPPFLCSLVGMDRVSVDLAESKLDRAIEIWRDCLGTNRWPAYPSQVCWASPPTWAITQWEQQMQEQAA